ncbi:hypothetical protein [Nostoc commune]|nr:hypothetical protein [Nostoc commune]
MLWIVHLCQKQHEPKLFAHTLAIKFYAAAIAISIAVVQPWFSLY